MLNEDYANIIYYVYIIIIENKCAIYNMVYYNNIIAKWKTQNTI